MSKNLLGVDIGAGSIKIVERDQYGTFQRNIVLVNPSGKSLVSMSNSEKLSLVNLIKNEIITQGISGSKAVVSVPDSVAYAKVMKFPRMSTPELATAIKWELDQKVPFPPSEIEMSWSLLENVNQGKDEKDLMYAYVVALPSKTSELYVEIFGALELEIERLENESVAAQRSLRDFVPDNGLGLSIDFGYTGTNLLLFTKDSIYNSYYYSVGGVSLTRLISDSFSISLEQAENYKRTYGLASGQLDGKMFNLLKPAIGNLILEIKKMLTSYRNDYGELGPLRIIISGGGSYMVGLIPFLTSEFEGVEIVLGSVFDSEDLSPEMKAYGPLYVIANGLSIPG